MAAAKSGTHIPELLEPTTERTDFTKGILYLGGLFLRFCCLILSQECAIRLEVALID
jgi:hypothetical protein